MIKTWMKTPMLDQTEGKSAHAEEHDQKAADLEDQPQQEFNTGNEDESPVREALNEDVWHRNPLRPPTPDREWHKTKTVDNRPPQPWITQMAQAVGTQSLFNEFLATPIDFSAFIMHRLKIDNLTQEVLIGLTYDLIKGMCKSVVELEYHLEEVFKATNDRLDWHNPKGKPYPHDLSKPLPLILNEQGRQVIPLDHFINNDLEYLKGGSIIPRVLVSSMSDSEDSTVTYTEISSPYEDLSDIGSPGAEGPIFQDPPSPDYVPGPEEPEQAPPSPIYVPFVPEPVYPEFLPEDDVLPAEEQPLPVAASPTTESPGYIPESDPEEDPEEDDEEDPEEDPADYPADRGDDRDDEEPSDDDDDDDDDAEEEHLAPADPAAVAYSADQDPYLAYRVTARMSIRPQAPAPFLSEEVAERLLALPTPPPSPLSPYSSPLPQIPSPPLPIPSQPPNSPTYVEGSLGSRAAGIRQRDALPSPVYETEMPEICLPLRKRLCRTTPGLGYEVGESSAAGTARQVGPAIARADLYGFADMLDAAPGRQTSRELGYGITDTWDDLVGAIQEIAPTTLEGVNQRVTELVTTVDQEDEIIYSQLDDARHDRALLRARVNMLYRDIPFYRRTALLMEKEARQSEITELQEADRRRQGVITDLAERSLIHGPAKEFLQARATKRRPILSDTASSYIVQPTTKYYEYISARMALRGTEGAVNLTQWFERMETVFRISNCTVENQVKFATCTLMGTALTWWNSHARTVTNEVAYAMTWSDLKKKMTTKYCPRNEIKKVEAELWNLKVQGTDVVAYNQRFQELALLCDRMFPEETDKIERYVGGMPDLIYSSVVASKPKTMQEAMIWQLDL
ncbi:putative reverse transcriptase domain-containing protein [Tanacetum coccineum]